MSILVLFVICVVHPIKMCQCQCQCDGSGRYFGIWQILEGAKSICGVYMI